MNIVDIILCIPLIWFGFKGFKKGLIIEITSLVALILGIYIAYHFSSITAEFLTSNFDMKKNVALISFIITFVGVVIGIYFIGKLVEKFVDIVQLGFVNKIGGLVFGILKTAFIISTLFYIVASVDKDDLLVSKEIKDDSLLYRPVASLAPIILPNLDLNVFRQGESPKTEDNEEADLN